MLNVRSTLVFIWYPMKMFLFKQQRAEEVGTNEAEVSPSWDLFLLSFPPAPCTPTQATSPPRLVFSISLPSLLPCIKVQTLICEPSVTILLHNNQNENDASWYLFCSEAEPWILTPRKMFGTSINYQAVKECLAMLNKCICCGCVVSVGSLTVVVQHLGKHPSTVCSTFFQHSANRDKYMELKAVYAYNSLHTSIIYQFPQKCVRCRHNFVGV